ncbi:MAG: PIG-L deacetylase family protein [Acidimicrobiales bacterium]
MYRRSTPGSTPENLPKRLLGVWAHPDDEAYLSAGLMARMADAGHSVTVVTATRGEKGTDAEDPRFATSAFAAFRDQELRSSLSELGVDDVRFLGYGDGDCDLVPDGLAVAAIETVITEVRPDVVITFGPDGITGHPDHRAVSRWTTEAWRRTGAGDLRYATMTDEFVARHADLHAEMGAFDEFGLDGPFSIPGTDLVSELALSDAELDRKRRALAAHASQTTGLAEFMGEATYRTWWRAESFRRPTATEMASCPLPQHRLAPTVAAAA